MLHSPLVLLVDDDVFLARAVQAGLEQAAFTVQHCTGPEEALRWLRLHRPDIIVLDVDLQATRNGFDLCRLLRRGGWTGEYALRAADFAAVPILLLTGKGAMEDKLNGYSAGTDDYMTKNDLYLAKKDLDIRLLAAHLSALLKRNAVVAAPTPVLRVGELTLYPEEKRAVVAAELLDLTPTEYKVLYWLAQHPGVAQSRATLLQEIWGYQAEDNTRTVDVCIRRLREKLAHAGCADLIQSKHGVGYFLAN
ncbi:MAG: response regulator transcription factor [Caldilineaceae bacterium]